MGGTESECERELVPPELVASFTVNEGENVEGLVILSVGGDDMEKYDEWV